MTLDSVFRIASMTKAVTGTAAMQLVEEGRIGLDQPMGDVLPVIKNVKVLEGFDAGGAPRLRDPRGPVTLRHLLTHTSGYGYDIFNPDIARYVESLGLPSIMSHKNGSLRVPLLFDPGTGWEYGIGIDLAGKVVETVTGQTLEAYFSQHIFEPLGMRDTSFLLSDDMARRLVGTHIRGADGKPAPISFESPQDGDFYRYHSLHRALRRMGSPWRDRRSLRASGPPPQRPGTSPCRTRQGLVPYPWLFGDLRHHHASRRAAAWAQSILRQARLRAVRSNERFSDIGRLMVSPPSWPMRNGSRTATYSGHYT